MAPPISTSMAVRIASRSAVLNMFDMEDLPGIRA
jgi:hypothetical protein